MHKIGDNLIYFYTDINGLVEKKTEKERLMKKSLEDRSKGLKKAGWERRWSAPFPNEDEMKLKKLLVKEKGLFTKSNQV